MEPRDFDEVELMFLPPHEHKVLAKDQPQYKPLPVVRLHGEEGRVISRWVLTDSERAAIAAGADIYVEVLTYRELLQPLLPTVGLRDFCPADVQ